MDIIATIWDFDKTLISGYMQEPIFKFYNIDSKEFWKESNNKIKELEGQGLIVNADTFYLNQMLRYVKDGKMAGLNNQKLKEFGKDQHFFDGIIDLFKDISSLSKTCCDYDSNGIIFENYIISSGLRKVIEGSALMPYVKDVWGCEFAETLNPKTGEMEISDIAYSIDNTTKTRALFEINKGVNVKELNIDVNSAIPQEKRRIQFRNMIYIADGPSDIPAFSVLNQRGGYTFAVYPKGDQKALNQVDKMRSECRVQMYAEADYTKGSTAQLWIMNTLRKQAQKIIEGHKLSYQQYGKGTPEHLT